MLFVLTSSDSQIVQSNTKKVRVHLRTGVAEIYDQHLELMGLIDKNIIDIEANVENKIEKSSFLLQEGVFVVSNKGSEIDSYKDYQGTRVYIYAKRFYEISPTIPLENLEVLMKECTQKQVEADDLSARLPTIDNNVIKTIVRSRIQRLKEDVAYLEYYLELLAYDKKA